MSLTVQYQQDYPGGPSQDNDSLGGFNVPLIKSPSEPSKTSQGSGQGAAEMNSDKTIVVKSDAASTNWDAKVSNNSTVQAKTCGTYRGDF
jgi:hypothetical protein